MLFSFSHSARQTLQQLYFIPSHMRQGEAYNDNRNSLTFFVSGKAVVINAVFR